VVYAVVLCLSVITPELLNIGSYKQCCTVAHTLSFSEIVDLEWSHLHWMRQMSIIIWVLIIHCKVNRQMGVRDFKYMGNICPEIKI